MSTSSWPDHLLGIDEWDALPEDDSRRVELVEGVMVVSPRPVLRHQRVVLLLAQALGAHLPQQWCALTEVEMAVDVTSPPTIRVPDVVIVRRDVVDDRPRCSPSDVLAVVEVLSPGSRRTDRVAKLAEYAEAGITHYAIADPGPPCSLAEFRLADGRYELVTSHEGVADVDLGVGLTLDLDALR